MSNCWISINLWVPAPPLAWPRRLPGPAVVPWQLSGPAACAARRLRGPAHHDMPHWRHPRSGDPPRRRAGQRPHAARHRQAGRAACSACTWPNIVQISDVPTSSRWRMSRICVGGTLETLPARAGAPAAWRKPGWPAPLGRHPRRWSIGGAMTDPLALGHVPWIFGGADRCPERRPAAVSSSPIAPLSAPREQAGPCRSPPGSPPASTKIHGTPPP